MLVLEVALFHKAANMGLDGQHGKKLNDVVDMNIETSPSLLNLPRGCVISGFSTGYMTSPQALNQHT